MHAGGRILLELFLMFVAAKVAGELFERIRQPAVVGEVLAGVLLGPFVLGWVRPGAIEDTVATMGVVLLMLMVGLETKPGDLVRVGPTAALVAVLGVVVPFAAGYAFWSAQGRPTPESLFVAAALVATSVGITARVLAELGLLATRPARIVLAAAVIDDVLGLIVLSVVEGLGEGGVGELGRVAAVAAIALVFVALQLLVVPRLVTRHYHFLDKLRIPDPGLTAVLVVMLGLAALSESIGLAAIIGAFFAGMAFSETPDAEDLRTRAKPLHDWLVPYFFVVMGTQVDVGLLARPEVLVPGLALIAIAIATKVVGCGVAAWAEGWRCAVAVGVGMVPRGEVGLIVASVGAASGLLPPAAYAIVVLMSLATTVIVPPFLSPLFKMFVCKVPEPETPVEGT